VPFERSLGRSSGSNASDTRHHRNFRAAAQSEKSFLVFFSKKNKCLLFYKKEAKNFCPFSPRRLPCPDAARANLR
jgi:hypothetical protein